MDLKEIRELNEITEGDLKTLKERLKSLQDILKDVIEFEWHKDGCTPPRWELRTALGERVAQVDPWMEHFQEPYHPQILGVRVQIKRSPSSYQEEKTILIRKEGETDDEFIFRAKKLVEDEFLPNVAYNAAMTDLYPRHMIMVVPDDPKEISCPTCGRPHNLEDSPNVQH